MRGTHTSRSRRARLVAVAAVATAFASTGWVSPASAHVTTDAPTMRKHIVNRALSQIGTPYRYGAESPRSGFDCSGLTYWTFRRHGDTLPRTSLDQWRLRRKAGYKRIFNKSNLRKGDLLFFKTSSAPVGHVGIYIGNERMVHTGSSSGGVRKDSINESYYRSRYVGAVRVPALRD